MSSELETGPIGHRGNGVPVEYWPRSRRPGEEPGAYLPADVMPPHRSFRLTSRSPADRAVGLVLELVLGVMCLGVLVGVISGPSRPREPARRAACRSNLRQIALACDIYAQDNAGQMPDRLEALYPLYADNARVFSCPSCPASWQDFKAGQVNAESSSYELVPGLSASMPGDTILAYDRQAVNHQGRGRNVAFVDGRVEWLREDELARRLAEQRQRLAGDGDDCAGPGAAP